MQKINNGLNLELEALHQNGTERQFSAFSPAALISIPEAIREDFLPVGEEQNIGEEKFDCASRGPLNILAPVFTYGFTRKLFKPENIQWLEEKGYLLNGKIDFSDRFTANMSGTTKNGNSLKAPCQSIHADGLIPKSLLPQCHSFDEYYDKSKITQEMKDLGQEFLKRFSISYEQVNNIHFSDVLKDDFLDVAAYAWPVPVNDIYPPTPGANFNHAFALFKNKFFAFDNYLDYNPKDGTLDVGDFIKQLSSDYIFFDYAYRVYVSAENVPDPLSTLPAAQAASLWDWLVKMITWIANGSKPPMPQIPSEILPEQKPADFLTAFCLSIKSHEGWATPGQTISGVYYQNGSVSYRCNNPGNTRFYTGGYLPIYGMVQESTLGKNAAKGIHGFAQFKDYATGYLYLKNLVTSKIKKHPAWTFYDFFGDPKEGWAPASDNNDSKRYAEVVAKACGVQPTRTLFNLL